MKKMVAYMSIVMCILLCFSNVVSANFTDVKKNSDCYNAVSYLSRKGIINGYEDGSFRPDAGITRAEACAVIIRSVTTNVYTAQSSYDDVDDSFWGCDYIMAATRRGVVNGMGNGKFMPNSNVTYNQIIKMIVCLNKLESEADKLGGWPRGYVEVAYRNNYIEASEYYSIINGTMGDKPAGRGDVARYVYNANYGTKYVVTIDGKEYIIGMDAGELGTADEILSSVYGFKWHVFGTDDYENFFAAGVDEGVVVALSAVGESFNYNGYSAGMVVNEKTDYTDNIYVDQNYDNRIHAIYISELGLYRNDYKNTEAFAGESKMNFHYTNAFRVYHGEKPLAWSSEAAISARLHSQDLADNDYFSHTSLDGTTPAERLTAMGIKRTFCGENIAGGQTNGFDAYDGWVNSSGHRENMLNSKYKYLGVGMGYNENNTYRLHYTQNFFG